MQILGVKISRILPALAAITLALSAVSSARASGGVWGTDYSAALAEAAQQKRNVLLDFTGSDWCGWCIRIDKEIFSTPEFKEFAAKNLILLTVDFPNNKPQSASVKKQNEELQKKYSVDGFPTLVLLNPEGKEIARQVGYLQGGPKAFVSWVTNAAK